jgi:hypothetical protein
MGKIRNPRYAPESLERKLSPSGFTPYAVYSPIYTTPQPTPPPPGPGDPPIVHPAPLPIGPAGPAAY